MVGSPVAGPAPAPRVAALFSDAAAFDWHGPDVEAALHPAERPLVARAVDGRRRHFAAGRACARAALASLGIESGPILRRALRDPRWPHPATGSISHCDGYAVAAVRRTAGRALELGIDAELVGRVTPALHPRLFRPEERAWLATLDPTAGPLVVTALFGAKEAFYKAQFPITGAWVGFEDVSSRRVDDLTFELVPATDLAVLSAVRWPVTARAVISGGVAGSLAVVGVEVEPAGGDPTRPIGS
ncbi:MAG: 4'-phosphopantetheinyl transferase [Acidimicrobiales bacterium]